MLHKAMKQFATQNLAKTRVLSGALKVLSIVALPMIITGIRNSHSVTPRLVISDRILITIIGTYLLSDIH